jgi:cephalosporin hydroxylase
MNAQTTVRPRRLVRRARKTVRSAAGRARFALGNAYWRAVGPIAQRQYARYYEHLGTAHTLTWLGVELKKLPGDLWTYQELLNELRPALVVETGTYRGGSALYLASIMDILGRGEVVTIELNERDNLPRHERIEYVVGSSTDPAIVAHVRERCEAADGPVVVVLDSYHGRDHVLAELESYHRVVTPGSYLIVEDTSHNGHPTKRGWGPGPWEAVDAFLAEHADFTPDRTRERLLHTQNPRGFLRRQPAPDADPVGVRTTE